MRIAILTKHTLAHGLGGVQVHAEGLAHGLVARGHEVVVLTTALPRGLDVVRQDGVEFHFLSNTRSNVYSRSWWEHSVLAFERLHRVRPFDLVLSEDLAGSGVIRRLPEIPHLPFLQGLALEHVLSELRQIEGVKGTLKYFAIKIPEMVYYALIHERSLIRRARMLGLVSRRAIGLIQQWYRVPEGALRLLPNWVDVDLFRPDAARRSEVRSALGIPLDAFVFLMASVLTKQKGVQVGLEAFARCLPAHPHLVLLVVGEGPYRPTLDQKVRALGLDQTVRFVGSVPNAEAAGYYQASDVFLFPTLRVEGIPFVVLEAMASALPVIASRSGGVPEAVGDAGFVVPPGDNSALMAAMLQLLGDPHLARRMGAEARERVKRLYAKEVVLGQVEEACRELLEA
jgi:glycosyltransferase involved in cell wall biosynthesis